MVASAREFTSIAQNTDADARDQISNKMQKGYFMDDVDEIVHFLIGQKDDGRKMSARLEMLGHVPNGRECVTQLD